MPAASLLVSTDVMNLSSKMTKYKTARGDRTSKFSAPAKKAAWRVAAEAWCKAPANDASAPHCGEVPFGRLRRFRPMNSKRPLKPKSAAPKEFVDSYEETMEMKRLRIPRAGGWDVDYPWRRGEPPNMDEEVLSDCADERRVHSRRRRRRERRTKRSHSLTEQSIRRRGRGSLDTRKELEILHELRSYFDPMYRIFLVKRALRLHCEWHHGSAELGLRMLYNEINTDNDDHIDQGELRQMVKLSGIRVRKQELVDLWEEIDVDRDGSIEYGELRAWLVDDSDAWLADRRMLAQDSCNDRNLLMRESLKFDIDIKEAIDEFWDLVDEDKNGSVSLKEYIHLSVHLQQAVDPGNFDMAKAKATALREWEFDCQGYSFLDKNRFMLSFFQMADAWAPVVSKSAYAQFLHMLLDVTSVAPKDKSGQEKDGAPRKWLWDKYDESNWVEKSAKKNAKKRKKKGKAGAGGGDDDVSGDGGLFGDGSEFGSPMYGAEGGPGLAGGGGDFGESMFLQKLSEESSTDNNDMNPDGGMVNPLDFSPAAMRAREKNQQARLLMKAAISKQKESTFLGAFSQMVAKSLVENSNLLLSPQQGGQSLAIEEVEYSDTDSSGDEADGEWEANEDSVAEEIAKWDAMMAKGSSGKRDAAKLPDRATQLAKDMAETLAAANANFERQSTGRQRQYILPKIGSDLGPVVTDADMGRPCSTWSLCLMSPRGGSGGSPPRSPI